jgi:Alpha-L-fucosidase
MVRYNLFIIFSAKYETTLSAPMSCRLDFFIGSICLVSYPCVGSSGKNGHPSEFGFKDILPLFKAERWNPDSLVALYVSSSSDIKAASVK